LSSVTSYITDNPGNPNMQAKIFDWLHALDKPQDAELLKDFQAWASQHLPPDPMVELTVRKGWKSVDLYIVNK
jgi:hypothetical protein